MTHDELHRLAERIARERGISHYAALSALGKRGAEKRRARYGKTTLAQGELFGSEVERPARAYWWQDQN